MVSAFLLNLKNLLIERSTPAYLVGGFVRDLILGRETRDVDIAVGADAIETARYVAARLGGTPVVLDQDNGVARLVPAAADVDRGAPEHVDFSTVAGGIEADLARRDITINSLALDISRLGEDDAAEHLIDPFRGRSDIIGKLVRATSDGAFEADPVRLLRAVRFAAELGFSVEPRTQELIARYYPLISRAAGERVREEMCRLLRCPGSDSWLHCLDRFGLLSAIIPELAKMKGVTQPKEHHWDVFDHSIHAVRGVEVVAGGGEDSLTDLERQISRLVPAFPELAGYFDEPVGFDTDRRVLLKWTALLHDVAKPQTKMLGGDGRTHFFGHAEEGAEIARNVLSRLRFSNQETDMVAMMVKNHLRPTQMSTDGNPTPRAVYRFFRDTDGVAVDTMFFSLADHLASRGPELDLENFRAHCEEVRSAISRHLASAAARGKQPRLVTGHDIMERFNLAPGPAVGSLLEDLNEAIAAGEISTREEAFALVENKLLPGLEGRR